MPDPSLHGNGYDCPACALRREDQAAGLMRRQIIPCNACGGLGRVPRRPLEIVQEAAAEARRSYWPVAKERWRHANND